MIKDSTPTDADDCSERRRPKSVRRRSASRLAAVQTLFQSKSSQAPVAEIIPQFQDHFLPDLLADFEIDRIDTEHYNALVFNAADRKDDIDAAIAPLLRDDWSIDRLGSIERIVMGAAMIELSEIPNVPARAIITEYTAIADSCGGDSDFVNAILDRLARHFRGEEMSASR
jgi:N utilization substance protein B